MKLLQIMKKKEKQRERKIWNNKKKQIKKISIVNIWNYKFCQENFTIKDFL